MSDIMIAYQLYTYSQLVKPMEKRSDYIGPLLSEMLTSKGFTVLGRRHTTPIYYRGYLPYETLNLGLP